MPISPDDIVFKLSTLSGSAGDTNAGTPDGSLGRYVSTTQITDAALNNLFDNVTGDENAAFNVEYRCIFVHNTHPTLTLQTAFVWMVSEIVGGSSISISVDTTAASDADASAAQAKQIATSTSAPSTQTFSSPTSKAAGLSIGSLPPDFVRGIWVRRAANNSGTFTSDGATIRIEGETNA